MTEPELAQDITLQDRAIELTNQYTDELNAYCDERVPVMLSNAEYAASCSALLIALTRQLGRCAAAFAKANGQEQGDVGAMVLKMFTTNHRRAVDALGETETVQ